MEEEIPEDERPRPPMTEIDPGSKVFNGAMFGKGKGHPLDVYALVNIPTPSGEEEDESVEERYLQDSKACYNFHTGQVVKRGPYLFHSLGSLEFSE